MVPGGTLTERTGPLAMLRPGKPWIQVTVGVTAVVGTLALGAFLHVHPGLNAIDRVGFTLRPAATHTLLFRAVTRLGTVPALALGSVGAALVARFTGQRDRRRALACLIGPLAAAALDEFVMKPLVGRRYLGEFSFASGSVTVVAGVTTAWVLAVPRRFRPAVEVIGAVVVALTVTAVVALQWHYPSDALAGVALGAGMVLLIDAGARIGQGGQPGDDSPGVPRSVGRRSSKTVQLPSRQ
jgi:hypothetical protein